jgi:alpha-1,3-rhamnosyltransferase
MTFLENERLPLVSVIVSCYNHATYIEECLKSILTQTYPNIELLVVDDGSRDGSAEIIAHLQKEYGFSFCIQDNQGLPTTLNAAISRSKGVLIVPFGSDDIMLPERIEKQVSYMMNKPEVGICGGNIECIDADGLSLEKQSCKPAGRFGFAEVFAKKGKRPPMAPTLMFRRKALEQVGGFDTQVPLEDFLIVLRITHTGYFIDRIEDVLTRYRLHDSNTSKNQVFMVENVLKSYDVFCDHPLYGKARAHYLNSMLIKTARKDRVLFFKLLRELSFRDWNHKTLRALFKYIWWGVKK